MGLFSIFKRKKKVVAPVNYNAQLYGLFIAWEFFYDVIFLLLQARAYKTVSINGRCEKSGKIGE